MRALFFGLVAGVLLSSCDYVAAGLSAYDTEAWWDEAGLEIPIDRETGKPLLEKARSSYRSTGYESFGPSTAGLSSTTEVWAAPRRWYEDSDEPGRTWDEKFSAWVDSLREIDAEGGYRTVEIVTPQGVALASPRLECAELAMFLRAAFASWYGLPFYMSAWHPDVGNMHFGHFGIVDDSGKRVTGYPTFATSYKDYTDSWDGGAWPTDADLASRKLTTLADDHNTHLGEDAYSGAYFDAMFLNKRVGQFLLRMLTNMGSMHVASDVNSWDLEPEAIREGDVLVQRWQSQGIGHVVVLKEVDWTAAGVLEPEVVYGSMPRIQPKWYDENISRTYLTSQYAGGPETDSSGTPYSRYGGGLKRWRTPVQKNGKWVNIVPVADRESYISSTDYAALEGRIEDFERLMGTLTPEEERAAILERIEVAREALREKPASCSNRTRREQSFEDLYELNEAAFGMSRSETDATYRTLEDYVLAELVYDESKTCCWNSTTTAMYDIVMDYAEEEQEAGACVEPTVFRAEEGGYDRWDLYAHSTGRSAQWVSWSEDETCPQRGVSDDLVADSAAVAFCDLQSGSSSPSEPAEGGCGGVTWEGYCDGNTVVWCQDDALESYECPSHLTCDWSDAYDYFWCL